MQKVGLGGGCHWCTEAIFASLVGVKKTEQGWISSTQHDATSFSEAVLVHFEPQKIPLDVLIEIHLFTHSSTSSHPLRSKYRSAIYTFDDRQYLNVKEILASKQKLFDKPLITQVLPFGSFRLNDEQFLNYYQKEPNRPFCQRYIEPKLKLLLERYGEYAIPR